MINNSKEVFVESVRIERKRNLKNGDIAEEHLLQCQSLLQTSNITAYIMKAYLDMLKVYNAKTKKFAINMLIPIYDQALLDNKPESVLNNVYEFDYEIHNSSGQALRTARGFFLECVLESLFKYYAKDQFLSQVKIVHEGYEKRMDFVVGAASIYEDVGNFIYVTVKKSLRERGSQVLDEKQFLGNKILFFFYADDLKKLSDGIMQKFYNEDIVMVTYEHVINKHYADKKNVISYEKFFLEMLPAYLKDKENFKSTDFGIETAHQKQIKQDFVVVKKNA